MLSPAFATARRDAALAMRRAAANVLDRRFVPPIATSPPPSASPPPCTSLCCWRSARRSTPPAKTTRTFPSCRCSSRRAKGPSSEEFTEAALPQPAPEPGRRRARRSGHRRADRRRAALADAVPLPEQTPDVDELAVAAAFAESRRPRRTGAHHHWASHATRWPPITEPRLRRQRRCRRPSRSCSRKNVQQLAQKLLDTNMTDTELTWQQDGQQYSARVMRQPAPDSTGLEQVIAEIMTNKDGKRMKTRLSAQAPGVLAFHAAGESLGSEHPAARRRHRRPLSQQHRDRPGVHRRRRAALLRQGHHGRGRA